MTRRSDPRPLTANEQELLRRIQENQPGECVRYGFRYGKPGVFQRFRSSVETRIGWLFAVSFVGWLLFLAMLALMLLPGCSSPDTALRERAAFNATEQYIVRNANELAAGREDLATFLANMRQALDELQAAEAGERSNSSTSWLEVLGTALGSSTLVGGALHVARNATRKRDLGDLAERLEQLEAEQNAGKAQGGAA